MALWSLLLAIGTSLTAHTAELQVPQAFPTIQSAIDAAEAGDTIEIAAGTYGERLVVSKSGISIDGDGAVLDGSALGGTDIGIRLLGVRDVQLQGVAIRGFEFGLVLERAMLVSIGDTVISDNTDKDPSDGSFNTGFGVLLIASRFNLVADNLVSDNGHEGIVLRGGSSGNILMRNRSLNNGFQTGEVAGGCGIQLLGDGNDNNRILDNELRGNDWGILIGPFDDATDNVISGNDSHANHRAGLAVLGGGSDNLFLDNDASDNGLLDIPDTFRFDIFEDGSIDNLWVGNRGSANFNR